MAIKHVKGPALLEYWPKTASTAFTINTVVTPASGFFITATTSSTEILGVLQTSIASTDADYASATLEPVILPQANDEFEADLTNTTTFTATFVGLQCDLVAGAYVDATASSHKQFTILRQGTTTSTAIVKINGSYAFKNAS